jgi:hypothetical protein
VADRDNGTTDRNSGKSRRNGGERSGQRRDADRFGVTPEEVVGRRIR